MAHFNKPAEGSWTEHFGLSTEPISYGDSISPEFYALEQEAIFKKTWLNVGRVEQLPKAGSFFTKELDAAKTSLLIVKNRNGDIKAFHNMCRHRGNKLAWQDYPNEEIAGFSRQFTCKYHGWRYDLDGKLVFVQQEKEFFDLDKERFGLAPITVDVWEGFIFVTFNPDPQPLKDYMGKMGAGLAGYPFELMTQKHTYRSEIGSNWKLFIDAFMEFYHAPVLHAQQATDEESRKLQEYGYEALHYDIDGPHAMVSSWGGMSPPKDLSMVKPIERALRSGLFGPWEGPDIGELPEGVNPAKSKTWGIDSFLFFPNFMLLIWKPNWYLTYHYWPTSYNTHIFETSLYFAPPRNAFERLQQELAVVTFKEYGLQDANTLEATQTMLQSGAVTEFPLCDQEVMLRHMHTVCRDYVEKHKSESGAVLAGTASTKSGGA
jgi:phenylpropionate dioxygenase-like ring-hydroxylating dioxygenase large terminal subunit